MISSCLSVDWSGHQEDLLPDLSRAWGETDQFIIPWSSLYSHSHGIISVPLGGSRSSKASAFLPYQDWNINSILIQERTWEDWGFLETFSCGWCVCCCISSWRHRKTHQALQLFTEVFQEVCFMVDVWSHTVPSPLCVLCVGKPPPLAENVSGWGGSGLANPLLCKAQRKRGGL